LDGLQLVTRHSLVRVKDRVRERQMLCEQEKRADELKQSSFDLQSRSRRG
jgi:hypothetical protein